MFNFSKLLLTCFLFSTYVHLAGCASVVNGESQTIQFATRDTKGEAVEGADCEWRNTKKVGSFVSPSVISVRRDYDTLHVACRMEGYPAGTVAVTSKASPAMAGNILAGGIIGAVVDHSTGNAYEYPSVVIVRLGRDTEVSTPRLAPGQRQTAQMHKDASLIPAPSGFASLSDIDAVPAARQVCRYVYARYLGLATPKAIAFSADGACAYRTGPEAISSALSSCSRDGTRQCKLYAVDNNVVWIKK
jgi:hypothetical protein